MTYFIGVGLGHLLDLGKVDGVSCPIVHQLVKVVGEAALCPLGRWGRALGEALTVGMAGPVSCSISGGS